MTDLEVTVLSAAPQIEVVTVPVTITGGAGDVTSVDGQTGDVDLSASYDAAGTAAAEATARAAADTAEAAARATADGLLVPKTTQVNGHALSGNVTVSKSDVGLGSVDNTADTAKPVSTAQAAADTAVASAAATDATTKADAKVSDTVYGAGWDTDTTHAPSKNAVYDKVELLAPKASPTFTGTVAIPSGATLATPASMTATNVTGLPVGGISATGTPSSSTYLRGDGTWSTPAGGGGGSVTTDAIFDAKGDLAVGTGADTAAKLTVGANDTIPMADSAQTTGIKWGSPSTVKTALAVAPSDLASLGAGVATFLTTPSSANLAAALTDETGTGANVHATSPTLVTPALGTPSSATLTNATGLPLAGLTGGSNDDIPQRKSGAWTNRTMAQLAADLGFGAAVVAADVTHTQSNTTLSDVTSLLIAISSSATEIWFWEAFLLISAANTGVDVKVGFTVPTSCTMKWGATASASQVAGMGTAITTNAPVALLVQSDTYSFGSFAGNFAAGIGGWIFGGGSAGNVQLQFAQNTSSATDLLVQKGSMIRYRKLVA